MAPRRSEAWKARSNAKAIVSAILLIVAVTASAQQSTVGISFGNAGVNIYNLAINVGDTVLWQNEFVPSVPNVTLSSLGAEFATPVLNPGDTFSYTFTNAGFYAFRGGNSNLVGTVPLGNGSVVYGAITVRDWSNSPPAVTLNALVDGSIIQSAFPMTIQASVLEPTNVAYVQFVVDSDTNVVGVVSNAPYIIFSWRPPQSPGPHTMTAQAVDTQGGVTSSETANFTVVDIQVYPISSARIMPEGKLLFFYGATFGRSSSIRSFTNIFGGGGAVEYNFHLPGAFVDENLPGPSTKFYYLFNEH